MQQVPRLCSAQRCLYQPRRLSVSPWLPSLCSLWPCSWARSLCHGTRRGFDAYNGMLAPFLVRRCWRIHSFPPSFWWFFFLLILLLSICFLRLRGILWAWVSHHESKYVFLVSKICVCILIRAFVGNCLVNKLNNLKLLMRLCLSRSQSRLKELEQEAHFVAGEQFLITSSDQLREVRLHSGSFIK